MMKVYSLISILFIVGCIYDSEGECFRPLIETVTSQCKGYQKKSYPFVARYQKMATLGKTDSAQRWKDIVSCGGQYGDWQLIYFPKNYKVNGKFYKSISQCMSEKGYVYFHPAQCESKTSNINKNKCNL